MILNASTVQEKVDWNINNTSLLLGEEYYQKADYDDEPSILITKTIRFSDNKWKFSDEIHGDTVINFSNIKSGIFRVLSKKVALRQLFLVGNRCGTVRKKCLQIHIFIQFLEQEKYIYDFRYLTPKIIEEYIEFIKGKGYSKFTVAFKQSTVKEFLKEAEIAGYKFDFSQYQNILSNISWEEIKAEMVANKIPNIPKRIFKNVVQAALKDMDDVSLSVEDRMMACLILILSHTGMRKGELRLLEADRLQDITILDKEDKASILEFFTYKTTRRKEGRWTNTIAFPITINAYQTLEELSKERRIKGGKNYLYINKNGKKYSETTFVNRFDMFFYRHQEIFEGLTDFERTQVHCQPVDENLISYLGKRKYPNIFKGEKYFALNAHQFRVAIANILKGKVNLQWIREHMNHLDEEMTKHYFRDDAIVKETLYRRASANGNSLEIELRSQNNFIKNELSEPELKKAYVEINKFLKKGKFNIFKDIDEIINTLKYNPLRENIVGVCTKHLGILCERQYRLAILEKWYYLSPATPNIESFDFTYKRFLDKAKIVQHNMHLAQEDSKYQRDFENEYIALNKFHQNRFLPEYELILRKLREEGKESILTSFPRLQDIISNIDEIRKEVSEWVSVLMLKTM